MIQRLNLYLFRQLLIAFLFTTSAVCLVVLFSQSFRFLSFVVDNSATMWIFVELMGILIPTFLPFILPLSLGVAVLFTYHKFASDSELVVMRAAGVSSYRLAVPSIWLAALVTLLGLCLTTWGTPAANRQLVELRYKVKNDFSLLLLKPGSFNDIADGLTFYVNKRGSSGELEDIIIHDVRNPEKPVTIMAATGKMAESNGHPEFVIAEGKRQELDAKTGRMTQIEFDRYVLDLRALKNKKSNRLPHPREQTMSDLVFGIIHGDPSYEPSLLLTELHQRLAAPLLALSFAFIGFSVILAGEFNRRGIAGRILIGSASIVILQAGFLSLSNLIGKNMWLIPILYFLSVFPVIIATLALRYPHIWQKIILWFLPKPKHLVHGSRS